MDRDAAFGDAHADEVNPACTHTRGQTPNMISFSTVNRVDRVISPESGSHLNRNTETSIGHQQIQLSTTDSHVASKKGHPTSFKKASRYQLAKPPQAGAMT
jgi:hypothetical protein